MMVDLNPAEIAYLTATLERRRERLRADLREAITAGRPVQDAAEMRRVAGLLAKLAGGMRRD